MKRSHVLVTGATGRQGGSVARHLIERGHDVRALTRKPEGLEAQRLANMGARLVQGDFDRPETVVEAAQGMDAAFLVTTPNEQGPEAERRQGEAAVGALCDAGVQHIILSSVAGAKDGTGIPHFDSKAHIEETLEASPCTGTVVAPAFFRENLMAPHWRDGLQQGVLAMAMPPEVPLQNVEVDEVARLVSRVLEDRDRYAGIRIEVASDKTTPKHMARILSDTVGRRIRFHEIPLEDLRQQDPDFAAMFAWFAKGDHEVDIRRLRQQERDVEWRSFRAWAEGQPWHRLLDLEA